MKCRADYLSALSRLPSGPGPLQNEWSPPLPPLDAAQAGLALDFVGEPYQFPADLPEPPRGNEINCLNPQPGPQNRELNILQVVRYVQPKAVSPWAAARLGFHLAALRFHRCAL
jgi:hypothetical protein